MTPPDPDQVGPFRTRAFSEAFGLFLFLVLIFALVTAGAHTYGVFPTEYRFTGLGLAIALLVLSWIDVRHYLLPDLITLPLTGAGIFALGLSQSAWLASISGAVAGYGLIATLAWFWRLKLQREGIGLGDAKLLAAGGAWLGILSLPFILLIASSLSLFLIFCMNLFGKKIGSESYIPFGPMLALAIWVVWSWPVLQMS